MPCCTPERRWPNHHARERVDARRAALRKPRVRRAIGVILAEMPRCRYTVDRMGGILMRRIAVAGVVLALAAGPARAQGTAQQPTLLDPHPAIANPQLAP